jgi:hypothetical protein
MGTKNGPKKSSQNIGSAHVETTAVHLEELKRPRSHSQRVIHQYKGFFGRKGEEKLSLVWMPPKKAKKPAAAAKPLTGALAKELGAAIQVLLEEVSPDTDRPLDQARLDLALEQAAEQVRAPKTRREVFSYPKDSAAHNTDTDWDSDEFVDELVWRKQQVRRNVKGLAAKVARIAPAALRAV